MTFVFWVTSRGSLHYVKGQQWGQSKEGVTCGAGGGVPVIVITIAVVEWTMEVKNRQEARLKSLSCVYVCVQEQQKGTSRIHGIELWSLWQAMSERAGKQGDSSGLIR